MHSQRPPALRDGLARDTLAGLVASAVTGPIDGALDRMVSDTAKQRARRVREDSPHALAGPRLAAAAAGRPLSRAEARAARVAFSIAYGAGWGALYGLLRRRAPGARRFLGLPFALPFFVVCDGVIAPLLRLSPPLQRLPWPIDAKELANHVVWTASAEACHRYLARRAS